MRKLLFVIISLVFVFSCKEKNEEKTVSTEAPTTASASNGDSAAIADAVHGFYKWYGTFYQDHSQNVDFTDRKGKLLKLDQTKFDAYFSHFKNSGFVSADFIANEAAYYKDCEVLWQKENKDEVVSCLDADRYFCTQEEPDYAFYSQAPVKSKATGDGKAIAIIERGAGSEISISVELKKENGKWLITKAGCSR